MDAAYDLIPEYALEYGVSCFKMVNGFPEITNIRLATSLAERIGENVFAIDGTVVGIGLDGDPLVSVEASTQMEINSVAIMKHIFDVLKNNFRVVKKETDKPSDHKVHHFCIDEKEEYTFCGYTFSDPKNGFVD